MRRVAQRNYELGDCGIACAAMIAGCTYDYAHSQALRLELMATDGTYYTTHADMQRLLARLGVKTCRRRFMSMRLVETPSLVKVNPRDSGRYWHWVVLTMAKDGRVVLDPEPGKPVKIYRFSGYKGCGFYLHAA